MLVIQGNEQHIRETEALLEGRIDGTDQPSVDIAKTHHEAIHNLNTQQYDCVVSELIYPRLEGWDPEMLGHAIGIRCTRDNIPFMLVARKHQIKPTDQHWVDYIESQGWPLFYLGENGSADQQ